MISGDSRILVQNHGYVQVKDIPEGSYPVWDGEKLSQATVTKCPAQPLLYIEAVNGQRIKVSEEQKFKTMQKRLDGNSATSAASLEKNHLLYFSDRVYEFDYLNLEDYFFLNKLSSEDLGILVGIVHCTRAGNVLDIPKSRKELLGSLDLILNKSGAKWSKEQYYKRTNRVKYTIEDGLLMELDEFRVADSLPTAFWTSKVFLKGFLKVLFTFGVIATEMFTIRSHKDSSLLKEIQACLGLFAINSTYVKGLKASQLIVFKNNCYRFAQHIGVFNPEILLSGVDFRKVLVYKDITLSDMRYGSVHRKEVTSPEDVYEIDSASFMANGLVLQNI